MSDMGKYLKYIEFFVLCFIFLWTSACNYQKNAEPTDLVLPTPNLTMTALFEPLLTQHASQTPVGGTPEVTHTVAPTEIQITSTREATPTEYPTEPPTEQPTDTPLPTISYAGPGMRSGESLLALHIKNAPNIDGYLGDWNNEASKYSLSYVVYGKSNWKNDNDLSATVMVGWDRQYLYIGARVKDDVFAQNQMKGKLYLGDSIEILMDTDVSDDFYLPSLNWDDFQLGISPGNNSISLKPEAYLWYPVGIRGQKANVQIAQVRTNNGYHIEAAIPWVVFNITPYAGQHFGFAFSVSDNDSLGDAVQESMISNIKNRSLLDPTTWGDLTLGY